MTAPRDPGLQSERTVLAWRRTLLSLAAGALVSVRVLLPVLGDLSLVVGLAGVGAAALLWALARRRHRAVDAVVSAREPASSMPGGALLLAVATLASAGAALGLLLLLHTPLIRL